MYLRTCTSMGSTVAATAAAAAATAVHCAVSLVYAKLCIRCCRIVDSGASLAQGLDLGSEQP